MPSHLFFSCELLLKFSFFMYFSMCMVSNLFTAIVNTISLLNPITVF